ncbi:hypothetical protein Tco_1304897 [Tanacetum coccineum]
MSSPRAPSTPSYSAGHSTPPSYSSGPSTPPSYSSGPSTPTNYSLGSSRNGECSNCKHLRGKISVLKATFHDVPIIAFMKEELSTIATKLGGETTGSKWKNRIVKLRILMVTRHDSCLYRIELGGGANDVILLQDEDYDIYDEYENDAYDLIDEQLTFLRF